MASDTALISRSSTRGSPLPRRYYAVCAPTPEHRAVPGVPARDLSPEEVERYGGEDLRNAQCYELVEVEPPPEESEAEPIEE